MARPTDEDIETAYRNNAEARQAPAIDRQAYNPKTHYADENGKIHPLAFRDDLGRPRHMSDLNYTNPRTPTPGTPEWLLLNFERITAEMLSIARAKNADYAGANKSDAFHNFRAVEHLGLATVEVGILTRMSDKLARIAALLKPGHQQLVKTESIEDTLKDFANYSIILLLYLRLKNLPMTLAEIEDRQPWGTAEREAFRDGIPTA